MTTREAAVVLVDSTGAVSRQNAPAQRLLGSAGGKRCWDVMRGASKLREDLPCRPGCARRLLASGLEMCQRSRITLRGQPHDFTCVPVGEWVVCTLTSQRKQAPERWQSLTERETDVLRLISQGATTLTAAEQLGLSRSTVRTHVEHMFDKLGARNRAALVARAHQLGLLD